MLSPTMKRKSFNSLCWSLQCEISRLPAAGACSFSWVARWCHMAPVSPGQDLPETPARVSSSGRKCIIEKLWREFFSDPSQWWDNRSEKVNPRYPDFKHKKTQASLWLDGKFNPSWVEAELAAMAPGSLQMDIFSWNMRLARYVKAGQYEKSIELFQQMQREGWVPDNFTFVQVLTACACSGALEDGRCIHRQIIQIGCESVVYIGNSLLDMYAKCGSIVDAESVFNKMPTWNVVSWSGIILALVKHGQGKKALRLFQQMQSEGVIPDTFTFVGVLKACASIGALEEGRCVHEQIIQRGCESDVFVGSGLLDMYAKCGHVEDAWRVFNRLSVRNVISWNVMILGYVKCGQSQNALNLFQQMREEGVEPNDHTFVGVLNACASVRSLEEGRHVHDQIIVQGLESDVFVANSLLDMYAKCGSVEDAWRVFNRMPVHTIVSWNVIILALVKCGQGQQALTLFRQMQQEGVDPNNLTFVGVLNACASVAALEEGRHVHDLIVQRGFESDLFVCNSLIDMYAKCGSVEFARSVFDKMRTRDVVSWNAMLWGYAMYGYAQEAQAHFEQMCEDGVEIDDVTFVCLLSACNHAGLVDDGLRYFDSMSSQHNISAKVEHYACVIDLLGRAGRLQEAEDLIKTMSCGPNTAVWIALLGACRTHGNLEMAERIAKEVLQLDPENDFGYSLLSNVQLCASRKLEEISNNRNQRD